MSDQTEPQLHSTTRRVCPENVPSSTHAGTHRRSDVVVIVPAYNEQESIEGVVASLEAMPYDYVVINDGSTDATAEIWTA